MEKEVALEVGGAIPEIGKEAAAIALAKSKRLTEVAEIKAKPLEAELGEDKSLGQSYDTIGSRDNGGINTLTISEDSIAVEQNTLMGTHKGPEKSLEPLSLRISAINNYTPGSADTIAKLGKSTLDQSSDKIGRRKSKMSFRRPSLYGSKKLGIGSVRFGRSSSPSSDTLNKVKLTSEKRSETSEALDSLDAAVSNQATYKSFSSWYAFILRAAEEKTRCHKYAKTSGMKILAPLCLFLDGNSSVDPTDDTMQAISFYKYTKKTSECVLPPIISDANYTPKLINDVIKNLFKPLEVFLDGPYPHTLYSPTTEDSLGLEFAAGTKTALINGPIFSRDIKDIYRFILTYHFFIEPRFLMMSLIEWYNVRFDETLIEEKFIRIKKDIDGAKAALQKRVLKIMEIWVKLRWQDFYEGEEGAELCKLLIAFVEYAESNSKVGLQSLIRSIRDQTVMTYGLSLVSIPLNINIESGNDVNPAEYLDSIPLRKFARTCYYISMSYMKVTPISAYMEFLYKPYELDSSVARIELSHLLNFISWLRCLGVYVMQSIDMDDQKKCKKQLKRAIILAKEIRACGDFSSLSAVLWALKSPRIVSQTQVWSTMRRKYKSLIVDLDSIFSPSKSYSNYWRKIENTKIAVVPYLAPHMSKAIKTYNEAATYLRKELFAPEKSESSPRALLEDHCANDKKKTYDNMDKNLESCYSIFRARKYSDSCSPSRYNSVLTRKNTAITTDQWPTNTDPYYTLNTSNTNISTAGLSTTDEPRNIEQNPTSDPKFDLQYPVRQQNKSASKNTASSSAHLSEDKADALINFQKYIDIQDTILDMLEICGIDTCTYRNPKIRPRIAPRYVIEDVNSNPFMHCIIKIAEGCDVDKYFNIYE